MPSSEVLFYLKNVGRWWKEGWFRAMLRKTPCILFVDNEYVGMRSKNQYKKPLTCFSTFILVSGVHA